MNVYFIDPTYVKSKVWKPLLNYLKVKAAYSFIPKDNLPTELLSIIDPYLKSSYSGEDMVQFSNSCVYWLREHMERYIHLITKDHPNVNSISSEERMKYTSQSPHNNLRNFDSDNCLILLKLRSSYNDEGRVLPPECFVTGLNDRNLPTHIASYCLNILHKKYQNYLHCAQSAFVLFDEYFSRTFRYVHRVRKGYYMCMVKEWDRCYIHFKGGKTIDFMNTINRGIHDISKEEFPILEKDGKKQYTRLITDEGEDVYKQFIDEAKEMAEEYECDRRLQADGENWQKEIEEMNREFWRECGESGSNCESWPGYD